MILKDLLETDWFFLPTGAELVSTDDATREFSEIVRRDFQGRGMLCAVCEEIPVDETSSILVHVNRTSGNGLHELAIYWPKEDAQAVREAIPDCEQL